MRALIVLFFLVVTTPFATRAGEPSLVEFETFQKEFETEPLADHHLFTQRVKTYIRQMEAIQAKKFASPKEKALIQKMGSAEGLKWVIERANARLAQMKDDPNNPTLTLSDPADLELAILKLRHKLDPKNVVLPPEKPEKVRFVLGPRARVKVVTQNDWNRTVTLIERHIKHLEAKKYENILTWDYAVTPKDKPAEIKRIEEKMANGHMEVLKSFLQSRDSTYLIPLAELVVTYVPSTSEYWEMKLVSKDREFAISSIQKGLDSSKSYGIFPIEEKAKKE